MPVTAQILIKEHESIEQDLIEIETIMDCEVINYANLRHVLKELASFLDEHEAKEEKFFNDLRIKNIKIPIEKISMEHGSLNRARQNLTNALNSGKESIAKEALIKDGKYLIDALRKHMKDEEWVFYALPTDEET